MALDRQRTLFVGIPWSEKGIRKSKFFDMPNINELNLIIWNPETLIRDGGIQTANQYGQPQPVRRKDWDAFRELLDTRVREILSWVNDGRFVSSDDASVA